MSSYKLYINDLPDNLDLGKSLAIDTEALGLNTKRDRLCMVQVSSGDGVAHLVQFDHKEDYSAPNLRKYLEDDSVEKIFHFARFDIAIIEYYMKLKMNNIYCTKIASRLTRTYTDHHGLKDLCSEMVGVSISKAQQCTNWSSNDLSKAQLNYAAQDVLYLHKIKEKLDVMLDQANRLEVAKKCFDFLATRVELDLMGWNDFDIFKH